MTYLDDAVSYAARGWSILPVQGKRPALRSWKVWQAQRPPEATLREWFARTDLDGLAVVCGPVSGGLVVRDFDSIEAYSRWAAEYPDLAGNLPTVETGRGRHVYFRGPATFHDFGDGEYRGDSGHYVVLPPSTHPSGKSYRWIIALPSDESLPIVDPLNAGLLSGDVLDLVDVQHRVQREQSQQSTTEQTEQTEAIAVATTCSLSALLHGKKTHESRTGLNSQSLLQQQAVRDAIHRTLPDGIGKRNRAILNLCRALKGIPSICDADPRELRPVLKRWHELALPVIGTKPFEESWIDFLKTWPKTKYPHGAGPMDKIFETVKTAEPPPEATQFEQPALRLLVALCRELQQSAGDAPFYLDCRTGGRLLGVDHTTVNRWLFLLTTEGLLHVAERGSRGKATRYFYLR